AGAPRPRASSRGPWCVLLPVSLLPVPRAALHTADPGRPLLVVSPRGREPAAAVILLHGMFQSARLMAGPAEALVRGLPHVRLLAPTAPTRPCLFGTGPAWFGQDEAAAHRQAKEAILEVRELAARCWPLEEAGCLARVVLAGFSQGGTVAEVIAATSEHRFAGLLLFGAGLPPGSQGPEITPGARGLEVLQCHGERDRVCPLRWARQGARRLRQCGARARFSRHRGVGHTIPDEMAAEARAWLRRRLPDPLCGVGGRGGSGAAVCARSRSSRSGSSCGSSCGSSRDSLGSSGSSRDGGFGGLAVSEVPRRPRAGPPRRRVDAGSAERAGDRGALERTVGLVIREAGGFGPGGPREPNWVVEDIELEPPPASFCGVRLGDSGDEGDAGRWPRRRAAQAATRPAAPRPRGAAATLTPVGCSSAPLRPTDADAADAADADAVRASVGGAAPPPGEAPLQLAAARGDAVEVKRLLRQRADPDARAGSFGEPPLLGAVRAGSPAVAALLLLGRCDPRA
ncbi:unnamed protein product, partial [Prorocentrum cordatum]